MQTPEGQLPPPPQFTPPPPSPANPPTVKWYYQKWFVVLMLLLFFPVGLVLLWQSPMTKTSGRVVWTVLFSLFVISRVVSSGSGTGDKPSTAASNSAPPAAEKTATSPAPTPKPADPPKDEYSFKVTEKSTGKIYKGKLASNVGVAVMDVKTTNTIGTNQFAKAKASGGATFVVVQVVIKNDQKDAVTMDGNLFKLLADGREYDYSTDAMTALMMDDTESFFLKKINPGLVVGGSIAFEVPESLKLEGAKLEFHGGFTGKSDTLPLKPVTE